MLDALGWLVDVAWLAVAVGALIWAGTLLGLGLGRRLRGARGPESPRPR